MTRTTYRKGFTLIELLIVMVILSILVAIVTGTYATSSKRGRDNRRKGDLRNIATALEVYYNDKGTYPTGDASGQMVGCCTILHCGDIQPCGWGGTMKDTNGTLYMVFIPLDPVTGRQYYYWGNGSSYKLYAKLENVNDAGTGVIQDPPGYGGTNCGSGVLCTYGISSSNTTP